MKTDGNTESSLIYAQAGTPTFMSPELCSGGEYSGHLADVWALGATMYMIRCGKPPFVANQVRCWLSHDLYLES